MTAYAEQYRPCYVNVSLYVTKICTAHSQQLACIVTSLTYLHQSWNEDVKASLILCAAYINSSCSSSSFFYCINFVSVNRAKPFRLRNITKEEICLQLNRRLRCIFNIRYVELEDLIITLMAV